MRADARTARAQRSRPASMLRRTHWRRWQTSCGDDARSWTYRSMKSLDIATKTVRMPMLLCNTAL
ncbi:hypothetical protein DIE06_08170 [Burkholderia sp. Bp8998]|nr:hypothetical protein DIE06_08170 [Burkholderia sp. Bp8998]